MQYVGNKSKIVKEILPLILAGSKNRPYYEPFVGSAAVISQVPPSFARFGNDKNPYLIALLTSIRDGWVPPEKVTEEEYENTRRQASRLSPELVGFVGLCCSFGGKFWGGYARGTSDPSKRANNYALRGKRALLDLAPFLKGVQFTSSSYSDVHIPDGAIVYCDPPYQGTTGYEYKVDNFGEFNRWCDKLVARDCRVFVSGYWANRRTGWDAVWKKYLKITMDRNAKDERLEVLFHKSPADFLADL